MENLKKLVDKEPKSFDKLYGGKLKQIFLYITNKCNLECKHCYMEIGETDKAEMSLEGYVSVLEELISLGATKATFLGGEPTIHPDLSEMVKIAREAGMDYLRLDTNGEFRKEFLEDENLKCLDDICFSLDGANEITHGKIRNERNYYNVLKNIEYAVNLGYNVRVTTTLNSLNIEEVGRMIELLEGMNVNTLNLHLTSNNGRTRNNDWLLIEPEEWMERYTDILENVPSYGINIKIPIRFISAEDPSFKDTITCESAKYSRLAIGPSFEVYSCPLLIDRGRYFAKFSNEGFVFSDSYKDNLVSKDTVKGPACPLIYKEEPSVYDQKGIIPICVSCKPTSETVSRIVLNKVENGGR